MKRIILSSDLHNLSLTHLDKKKTFSLSPISSSTYSCISKRGKKTDFFDIKTCVHAHVAKVVLINDVQIDAIYIHTHLHS